MWARYSSKSSWQRSENSRPSETQPRASKLITTKRKFWILTSRSLTWQFHRSFSITISRSRNFRTTYNLNLRKRTRNSVAKIRPLWWPWMKKWSLRTILKAVRRSRKRLRWGKSWFSAPTCAQIHSIRAWKAVLIRVRMEMQTMSLKKAWCFTVSRQLETFLKDVSFSRWMKNWLL